MKSARRPLGIGLLASPAQHRLSAQVTTVPSFTPPSRAVHRAITRPSPSSALRKHPISRRIDIFSHKRIGGIALALAGALAFSQAAVAAPSVQFVAGYTKVALSPHLLNALGSLGVALTSFIIENIAPSGQLRLTGVVKANDTIVGRIPLFSIALTKAPTVQPESGGRQVPQPHQLPAARSASPAPRPSTLWLQP